jgi:hypothetical protein
MSMSAPRSKQANIALWIVGVIFAFFFLQNTMVFHDAAALSFGGESEVQRMATVVSVFVAVRIVLSLVALYCVIKVRNAVAFWIIVATLIIGTPLVFWMVASLIGSLSPMVSSALLRSPDALLMDTIVVATLIYLFASKQVRLRFQA